jgi:beta-N-acetylhexosaminidase
MPLSKANSWPSPLPKAVIFSCEGPELLPAEAEFFKRCQPLGFILFERNCKNREQLKRLVTDLKATVNHPFVPILIDQEGGRIIRMRPPEWRKTWAPSILGELAQKDLEAAGQCAFWHARLIGQELAEVGINVNCAPCADLLTLEADPIIGDRAFSEDVDIITYLSLQTMKGLQSQGIIPVIKHLPGHGRSPVDSHKELPVVHSSLEELNIADFLTFQKISRHEQVARTQPWGMTAHVVYNAIDPLEPATHSTIVIEQIIRHFIGFQGFLISDCITMEALKGSYKQRSEKAFQAGCDAVLYWKAKLDDMIDIASIAPPLSITALKRLQASIITSETQPLSVSEQRDLHHKLMCYLTPYLMDKAV